MIASFGFSVNVVDECVYLKVVGNNFRKQTILIFTMPKKPSDSGSKPLSEFQKKRCLSGC